MNSVKVVQVPYSFHPDPVGGTEVYVDALARCLQDQGARVFVAAPAERDADYLHDNLVVRRFAVSEVVANLRELYGNGDSQAAQAFGRILDQESPDLVHTHGLTRGVSLQVVGEAQARRIPVVFTYHTPTVSCQRGTLMRWGKGLCDGILDLHTCSRCTLQGLGVGNLTSLLLGSLSPSVGQLIGRAGLSGKVWTALRMTELIHLRHSTFNTLMAEVDHVVALCSWAKELLLRNGVPAEKITLSRHGLPHCMMDSDRMTDRLLPEDVPLRVAFLGRLDPVKGLDTLIQALRKSPNAPVRLDLYGIVQDASGRAYLEGLKARAASDLRIRFRSTVSSDRIVTLLRHYHLLAVPSRWLETGPLVVLEAFAAGIPVIGSDLGGISELVQHGINGLLVKADSPEAWARVIEQLCHDRDLLKRLHDGVRPPRTMQTVAQEMMRIYRTVLKDRETGARVTATARNVHAYS